MSGLSIFDLLYALALLAGMAAGFARGFMRQLTELVSVYVGLAVAAQYTPFLTVSLGTVLVAVPHYVTGAIVFFVVLSVVSGLLSLVGHALLNPGAAGGRSEYDRSDASQIAGLFLGAFVASAVLAVSIPVTRHATAASWGGWDSVRQFLVASLDRSYMAPLFSRFTPVVLATVMPLLPGGLPAVLLGKLI